MLKEIITPIIMMDKLQTLKRDKKQFQVKLMTKDMKVLSKERKEEILSSKIYLDHYQSSSMEDVGNGAYHQEVLVIDRSLLVEIQGNPGPISDSRDTLFFGNDRQSTFNENE